MKPLQRATAHYQRGEYDRVEQICEKILASDSENMRAWQMRGLAAIQRKAFQDAIEYLRHALAAQESAATHINLAVALRGLGRPGEAALALERSLELDPGNAAAALNLGICYYEDYRFADSERALQRALELQSDWPMATDLLARAVLRLGDNDRAHELATRALAMDPSLFISHRIIADIAMSKIDYDLALRHYRLSLENNSEEPETLTNMALLFSRRGDYGESLKYYERAARALKNDVPTQEGLATMLLMHGKFEEGWAQFSWRHSAKAEHLPLVDQPFLSHLPGPGERAVAVLDQGLGDQIMIASMIPDLAARVARLEVECDARLQTLLQRSFPAVRFSPLVLRSTPGAVPTPGSFGLAEAGRWLRPHFGAFPQHAGYLKVNTALQRSLRARYAAKSRGPIIGISWASTKAIKFADHKSIPLAAWGPVLSMPGVTFVNLQYKSDPAEVADAARQFGAKIITDPTIDSSGDLDPFAAQVAAMDLVITTSSAAAHVAGALNVPAWVFVPVGIGAFWHWFMDREDSPWYPSARLFRQSQRGEWMDVLERASAELVTFVEAAASPGV